jgi:hypothetical protein
MASILIWGKARDLLAGALPPGVSVEEVDSLAAVRERLDDRGTLVLVDPAFLADEHRTIEAWLKTGGAQDALVIAVAEHGEADDVARRFPFLDDVLSRPLTSARLALRLERACDIVRERRVMQQLQDSLSRKDKELRELNEIGVALSAVRDINGLLEQILLMCREITAADAGSLYLVERGKNHESTADDHIRFKLARNVSVKLPSFEEERMPLDKSSIAGYVALTGEVVNVSDCYELPPGYPFELGRSFDEKWLYRTKSMLVVPMRDHRDDVIGVVQLINKKRDAKRVLKPVAMVDEYVIPFTSVDEGLV